MIYSIENDKIKVQIDSMGCEMVSLYNKRDDKELIWKGDAAVWKRHAPILFPLVGRYRDDECRIDGKTYRSTQHGFARDSEFMLLAKGDEFISFTLPIIGDEHSDAFPYKCLLNIMYRINGSLVDVCVDVMNKDVRPINFSLGGHPAFVYGDCESLTGCKIRFNDVKKVNYRLLDSNGLLTDQTYTLPLDGDGKVEVTKDFFDRDAYVIDNNQVKSVSLIRDGEAFITVKSDAPVFGIWSKKGFNNPFICIEPWYGCSDSADFEGEIYERAYNNWLDVDETFTFKYSIRI